MFGFFETILYQPIFNIFVALYNVIPDAGAVIVLMTVAIKGSLYPLMQSSLRSQKELKEIQPKLKKIKEEYDDQQKVAEKTMNLYKKHDVNPLSSCFPILIQIPIFIALYWVLRTGLGTSDFHLLYSFVSSPGHLDPVSLGYVNLANTGNIVLALMASGAQFFQTRMMSTGTSAQQDTEGSEGGNMMSMMNKQMQYVMPFITFFIGYTLPAGVALYWFLSAGTTALQQKMIGLGASQEDSDDDDGSSDKPGEGNDSKQPDEDSDDEEVIEGELVD